MDCPNCQSPNIDNARFCAKCGALLPANAPDQQDPLLGQIIKNTFRIVRMIGEGGMGRVYEGEQQMGTTTRKVAIKTLHPDLSKDAQIVARFNRECGTVAELEHPNTIQFFDFGQTPDGTLFIAMEFLEGQAVAKILEDTGAIAPVRVEKILRQICGSLSEAHKKGIVHRDLKPENVVLITRAGEEDFVKVLDFGIAARQEATDAKREQKLTQQGMVLGTPPYMSPEQFTGKELDARSDIYSLGVMAYEMLTGKLPFEAATPWEWATKHLTERPFPFEMTTSAAAAIPPTMKAAIMRALSKNRDERQNSVQEFLSELTSGGGAAAVAPQGAAGHSGTTAMAAPPAELFQQGGYAGMPGGGATGPMAMMPQPMPMGQGMGMPAAPVAPPPPPPRAEPAKSNRGPLIALIVVLIFGAIAGVIILVVTMKKSNDGPDVVTIDSANPPPTVVEPIASTPPTADTAAVADAAPTTAKTVATATPTKTAPTSTAKGPQGEEACQQSRQQANNGNIEAAVGLFRGCENGGSSVGQTRNVIARNAGTAARQASMRGDCARANSIANSASSINAAGTSREEAAKCRR